jgi:hypothetical protein
MKATNETTGTTHYARLDGIELIQTCGIRVNQRAFLTAAADDAEITCKRCAATTPKTTKPAARRYGRQEWTIGDLRLAAKLAGIKGYSSLDGDTLLARIIEVAPQYA